MDVGAVAAIVSIVAGVAAGLYGIFRASYATARYDDAEKRIEALRGDVTDAQNREARLERSLGELAARVKVLEDENAMLRSFVPTQNELDEVKRVAQRHYEENTAFQAEWRENTSWFMAGLERLMNDIKAILIQVRRSNGSQDQ